MTSKRPSDQLLSPERRAYHRDLATSIDAALRVAAIDQQALTPALVGAEDLADALDYLGTVCWLLKTDTYAAWRERQAQIDAEGAPGQYSLADF